MARINGENVQREMMSPTNHKLAIIFIRFGGERIVLPWASVELMRYFERISWRGFETLKLSAKCNLLPYHRNWDELVDTGSTGLVFKFTNSWRNGIRVGCIGHRSSTAVPAWIQTGRNPLQTHKKRTSVATLCEPYSICQGRQKKILTTQRFDLIGTMNWSSSTIHPWGYTVKIPCADLLASW